MPETAPEDTSPAAPAGFRRRRRERRRGDRRRRRRRWLRRLTTGVVALALSLAAAAFTLTRPAVLTPLLRAQLSAALGADVGLDAASFSASGVLRLRGLTARLPDAAPGVRGTPRAEGDFRRLLEVDELTARVGRRGLLLGRLDLRRVEVQGPTLHAVLDGEQGRSNLRVWADGFFGGDAGPPPAAGPVRLPPAISVSGAALQLVRLETRGGEVVEAERHRLPFDGTVVPTGSGPAAQLRFQLTGGPPPETAPPETASPETAPPAAAPPGGAPPAGPAAGTDLSGVWTPAARRLTLSLERVDLGSPLGLLMPPGVRRWWRDLDPAGALPALTLETRLDRSGADRLGRARLEVRGLSFRLPLASLGLLPEGEAEADAPRMSGVTGTLVVADGVLGTDDLTGVIEGIRTRVRGRAALEPGGALDLVVETNAFDVPAAPPLLFRLPGAISRLYEEYRPSGRFRARVAFERAAGASGGAGVSGVSGGAGPVEIDGRVQAIDGRATFHAFAYPVEKLRGEVAFDRDAIRLNGLSAEGPAGGRVVMNGTVTDPGPDAGIDLTVRVARVPLDGTLLGALDPELRETLNDYFSREAARGLAAAPGTPGTPGTPTGGGAFEPGGLLNGTVRVLRDTAVRPLSWVELDLDPEGLRVLMPAFAYPVTIRSGRLTAGPEEVRLEDVVFTGPTGGAGLVRGRVGLHGEGEAPTIDVRLSGLSLPVDRHLLAALDPDAADWLRRLGVSGRVAGEGLIGVAATPGAGPAGGDRTPVRLDLRLLDGGLSLWGGDVELRPAEADLRVTRDAVRVDRFAADWPAGGRVRGEGRVDLPGGGLRLGFSAEGLAFDERVALLIPPELPARGAARGVFGGYALSGVADAEATLTRAEGGELAVAVEARPTRVRGVYDGRPVSLSGVTGRVLLDAEAATLRELAGTGASGASRVRVSGRVPYDPAEATELRIDAGGPAADPLLAAFTPAALRDAAAAVGLDAAVAVEGARLRLGPVDAAATGADPGTPPPLPFDFAGRVTLRGAEASLGLPVTEASLGVGVRASGDADGAWPRLALEAESPSLRYAGRVVRRLRFRADNRADPAVVRVRGVGAAVAGGRLSGEAAVRLGGEPAGPAGPPAGAGSFRVALTLDGADAEAVLFPEEPPLGAAASGAGGPVAAGPGGGSAATSPPERRAELAGGRLRASLGLAGEAGLPETLAGAGRVRVRGGDLLRGQWGVGLLRAVNLGFPTWAPLGDADAEFTVADGQVRVRRASIGGEGLRLEGSGSVQIPFGELYLTFFTSRETGFLFRGLRKLFDTIKDEFIGIEVTGTAWEPDARVAALSALRGSVRGRLGETSAPLVVPAPEPVDAAGQ